MGARGKSICRKMRGRHKSRKRDTEDKGKKRKKNKTRSILSIDRVARKKDKAQRISMFNDGNTTR